MRSLLSLRSCGRLIGEGRLDVYGQSYKKITIAAPPFLSEGKPRPEASELLTHDLDMSGFFVVAPKSLMDSRLVSEGDREEQHQV